MLTRRVRTVVLLAALSGAAGAAWAQHGTTCSLTTDPISARYDTFGSTAVHILRAESSDIRRPLVVLTSYLALTDMDYDTRGPAPPAGPQAEEEGTFIYRALARRLACRGFTVVKYDPITLHRHTDDISANDTALEPDAGELMRLQRADFSGLLTAVLAAVDAHLGRQQAVIMVGHSGGAFTVGDFLAQQARASAAGPHRPIGFVGIAAAVSNDPGMPQTHSQHWVRSLRRCLQTQPAAACVSTLAADLHYPMLISASVREQIAALSTTHEGDDFLQRAESVLDGFARDTLNIQRRRLPGQSQLNGRYEVRSELMDSLQFRTPSAIPVSCLAQSSRLLYGDRDFVVWHEVESQAWEQACGSTRDIRVMAGLGHSLGQDKYFGPIDPTALTALADAVEDVARDLSPPAPGRHLTQGDGGRP